MPFPKIADAIWERTVLSSKGITFKELARKLVPPNINIIIPPSINNTCLAVF